VRPTLEEAMFEGFWRRRPSILEALRSYNMRAEKLFDVNVAGGFEGKCRSSSYLHKHARPIEAVARWGTLGSRLDGVNSERWSRFRLNCLKVRIGRRDVAKQNSFDCRTWNGQAARVVVGCETRKQRGFGAPEGGKEGQCLVG
jgi:hypothetical protein